MRIKPRRRPATRATPAESACALAQVQRLFAPTPREAAETRMRKAKAAMSAAAQQSISNDPDAAEAAILALEELNAAREALAAFADQDVRL
jgi:hypothetical protein